MVTPDSLIRMDFVTDRMAASAVGLTYSERNAVLSELGFDSYRAYLGSDLWREIRARVFANRGRACWVCRVRWAPIVHHRSYSRENLSGRSIRGMVPVCGKCHQHIETFPGGKKRPQGLVELAIRR